MLPINLKMATTDADELSVTSYVQLPVLTALMMVLAALSGCASYSKQIASTEQAIVVESERLQENTAEIARLQSQLKKQKQKLGYFNSEKGRRDYFNGQCNRVPVAPPQLTPRPEASCKTDAQMQVHAVNQCIRPANCEYVGALYALGRLPVEYDYIVNSGCPYQPEDKTFMQEYVGLAAVPLCSYVSGSGGNKKDKQKNKKGVLNRVLNSRFAGAVLDVAVTLACNVKTDPYRAEYTQLTQCLARESRACEQRYIDWENTANQRSIEYQSAVRDADRDFASCERELKRLNHHGGDIRLEIDTLVDQHQASIETLEASNVAVRERITELALKARELRAKERRSNAPRNAGAVFY